MDFSAYLTPVFIAKMIDFVVFVVAITYIYNRWGRPALEAHQEAQNKAVEDSIEERVQCERAVAAAHVALQKANGDSARMVEIGRAQAARLVTAERADAEEHAARILAHANGELERERYRVRREVLEETVERAYAEARDLLVHELDPDKQRRLVNHVLAGLERSRG